MRFLVRRLGFLVVALWAAMTVNFFIPRLMPGNPALAMMAKFRGHVNPNALHALEVAFGVHTHANVFTQYFQYLGDTLTGHLGNSLLDFPLPVTKVILQALPWTLGLVGVTTILGFVLGTAIGAISAWRRGGVLDAVVPPTFIVVSAFPYFWVGMLAIWLLTSAADNCVSEEISLALRPWPSNSKTSSSESVS